MAGYTQGRPSWLDFFPAEDRIVKGLSEKEEAVLLVDVGGGMGQDLEEFRRRMPSVKAELVLQDQEEFVERAKAGLAEKGIRAMAYDFFTPQPIKGDDNMKQVQKHSTCVLTRIPQEHEHTTSTPSSITGRTPNAKTFSPTSNPPSPKVTASF